MAQEKAEGHVGEVVSPLHLDTGDRPTIKGEMSWPFWIGLPFVGHPGALNANYKAATPEGVQISGKKMIEDERNKWILMVLDGDEEVIFWKVMDDPETDCGVYVVAEEHGIDPSGFLSELD